MGVKTRRPYRLSDDDFDTFCYVDMKAFLAGPNSLPHRPDHLVAQQTTLADDFHAKIDEHRSACDVRNNATSAFGEAATAIREKLRWMQMALPGLTPGSKEILVPFGLNKDVPADNDEMKNYADAIYAYWLTVRLQPLYAPFKANIDALNALFTAYETAQANQNAAQQPAALLQNEKEELRNQSEDVLAALIDWYRIEYKDPQDEYWTQTPWGKSSGESEEPLIPWPGPAPFEGEDLGGGTVELRPKLIEDLVDGIIDRRLLPDGPWEIVTEHVYIEDGVLIPHRDLSVPPGNYEYRFVPLNEAMESGLESVVEITVNS